MQSNQISLFTCLIIWFFFGSEMPSYDKLIPSLLEHGLETLPEHCHLTPGKYTSHVLINMKWLFLPVRPVACKRFSVLDTTTRNRLYLLGNSRFLALF